MIKGIFNEIDKESDYVVSRKKLIEALRSDVRIIRIYHLPAVYLQGINKQLNVDRVLYRIEKEEFIGSEQEKKNKEFITWNQFLDYFTDQ